MMEQPMVILGLGLVLELILVGALAYAITRRHLAEIKDKIGQANRTLEDAQKDAESLKKEKLLEAKDEAHRLRKEIEREQRGRKTELQKMERRLVQREGNLDRRMDQLEKKEQAVAAREADAAKLREELATLQAQEREQLQRVSGMSSEEARQLLLKAVESETRQESAKLMKEIEEQAREEGERKARDIISLAIQKCAVDQVVESTVSVVPIPSDDMKGRIIGREGRNIRAFENLTGVDLIIDDTPEAVVISGFDPVRREIARVALTNLIADGRIHPARIEEMGQRAQAEVEEEIRKAGERASMETGVTELHADVVKLLGKLKFRTSYGQNVFEHSLEVSHLAGVMAGELEANEKIARRAGLLHDLGKAVDFEVEGPHTAIGVDLARHYHESEEVIHAIAAHHGEEQPQTVEAVLVQAADALSAARPGARRETLETYIKRLEKLEKIADSFAGVEKSYAIQAGREIRIMVKPDDLDDLAAARLAKELAEKIEADLEYPGQIKITVIRETRAVEYAK